MRKKLFKVVAVIAILITMYCIKQYIQHGGKPSVAKLSEMGAILYLEGNYYEAFTYLQKAAKQGDSQAQTFLGLCYRNGNGVEKNDSIGAEWYLKAAEQGDSVAQFNLTGYYLSRNDSTKAAKWLMEAANDNMPEAQYTMGIFCQYGNGIMVSQDSSSAAIWYMKAAEQGHVKAQYRIGACYENGIGLNKNDSLAIIWYAKSAEENDPEALFALGRCYENGLGVKQNDTIAVEFYLKSAHLGNVDAQLELFSFYYEGKGGVPKDLKRAVAWVLMAARNGNEHALTYLNSIPDSLKQEIIDSNIQGNVLH